MPSSQRSISTSRVRTRPVTSTLQSKKRAGSRTCPLPARSEEHTSELQSQSNLVCRLLLEKKNSEQRYWYYFGDVVLDLVTACRTRAQHVRRHFGYFTHLEHRRQYETHPVRQLFHYHAPPS